MSRCIIFIREDELIHPSTNDKIARGLVEAKVKDDRYKISVPFKPDVIKTLPNNFTGALKRAQSLHQNAKKKSKTKKHACFQRFSKKF